MTTEMMVTIVVSVLASSGFWQFIMLKTQKKSTQTQAILALLHNEIYKEAEKAIERGSITTDDFDNLTCLYTPYKALGGNSTGDILYGKCKDLIKTNKGE